MRTVQSISTFGNVLNNSLESPQGSLKISSSRFELVKNLSCFAFSQLSLPASYLHNNGEELVEDFWNWVPLSRCRLFSLRKRPFLLALRRWGRFARRNVCDSSTEIPYWWRKICPESGQKFHNNRPRFTYHQVCTVIDKGHLSEILIDSY